MRCQVMEEFGVKMMEVSAEAETVATGKISPDMFKGTLSECCVTKEELKLKDLTSARPKWPNLVPETWKWGCVRWTCWMQAREWRDNLGWQSLLNGIWGLGMEGWE